MMALLLVLVLGVALAVLFWPGGDHHDDDDDDGPGGMRRRRVPVVARAPTRTRRR